MATKLPRCCAVKKTQQTIAEDRLRRAARRLAIRPDSAAARKELDDAKVDLAQSKENVIDHEAEHAGE